MVWVKIDDGILDNPKIVRAGPIGFALHAAAITWCARNLTDGFVPLAKAKQLLSKSWTDVPRDNGDAVVWELCATSGHAGREADNLIEGIIELLVFVGLWHEGHDDYGNFGYFVHDYEKYNPTRAEVLDKREKRASAGQAGGKQKASNRLAKSKQNSTPIPYPDPVPLAEEEDNARAMVPCPADLSLTDQQRASLLSSLVPEATIDEATRTWRAKYAGDPEKRTLGQWRRGLVTACTRASNERRVARSPPSSFDGQAWLESERKRIAAGKS